jgi:hypothetical protein
VTRFSKIATVYVIMGVVAVGTGVLPPEHLGIASVFLDTGAQGVTVNSTAVGGRGGTGGMLDNLIGPVRNALDTITGGALLAVWGPVSRLVGFYAWPVTAANHMGAPDFVVMLAGVLVASFTFGVLAVFRRSI